MISARVTALSLLVLLVACTLPTRRANESGGPINECSSDDSCGVDGVCVRNLCHARTVDPREVVFEVTPSQVSGARPGQTTQIRLSELDKPLTLLDLLQNDQDGKGLNLGLPPLVSVKVSLLGPDSGNNEKPTSARGCFSARQSLRDRSLPVNVALLPTSSQRGLALATYRQNAVDPNGVSPPLSYLASFAVPPARYHIYLTPEDDPDCPIPPLLQFDTLLQGPLNTPSAVLGGTSTLDGTVQTDPAVDLSGWTLQIVEKRTGLRVSTFASLVPLGGGAWRIGTPYKNNGTDALAPLEYYPPTDDSQSLIGDLFLRLSPPAGVLAPEFAWALAAIDFSNSGVVSLDLSGLRPGEGVEVSMQVEQGTSGQPATVWLSSDLTPGSLPSAPDGAIASFALGPLATLPDGSLSARVPPGRYAVSAVALASTTLGLGRAMFDFQPADDPGATLAGYALDLPSRPALEVPLLTPNDSAAVAGVPFELTASPSPLSLSSLFRLQVVSPRGDQGVTDPDGVLRAAVDAGTHDLTVRFPVSSGFPWLVKPRVSVPLAEPGALQVSLPIEVVGVVFDQPLDAPTRRPLAGGTIRVLLRVDDTTYIPVASTTLDANGAYRLLLPSRL